MRDKGEFFQGQDRYLLEPFERALFRWDHRSRTVWMKLSGQPSEVQVRPDNRVFNEAILVGQEVDQSFYDVGLTRG